jgi:uncharacterized protein
MYPFFKRLLRSLVIMSCTLCLFLLGCQQKIIYHPRVYTAHDLAHVNASQLSYTTAEGTQCAWLCPQSPVAAPELIWLVFGGNGSTALDFADYFPAEMTLRDLCVLCDYPGYGLSQGRPSPESIRLSIQALLPALAKRLGKSSSELQPRLRVFGHSLGCAAALMAMEEHHIHSGILIAPFTRMKDMARKIIGWPLCELTHHRYDNLATLQRLSSQAPQIHLIHGTEDEVIPFSHGQNIHTAFPKMIEFHCAEGARHNDILNTHKQKIRQLMESLRTHP